MIEKLKSGLEKRLNKFVIKIISFTVESENFILKQTRFTEYKTNPIDEEGTATAIFYNWE